MQVPPEPAAAGDPFVRALRAIADRPLPIRAWREVEDLPWGDAEFSERMLREHLDESHGRASRRPVDIARQVDLLAGWLGASFGPGRHVLDVTCGPGLVARELGRRGLRVTGVDIAPAAIRHARELCRDLACRFVLSDVREMDVDVAAFDTALYLFGQPTVQPPDDLATVLSRVAAALRPGGRLALEILRSELVDRASSTAWWTTAGGLWGDGEHLVLYERSIDPAADAVVERYHVVDRATGALRAYGIADRIVTVDAMAVALDAAGLEVVDVHPGWDGLDVEDASLFVVIVAERR